MIKFYNSLSKQLEQFTADKQINIYSCGPTVYDFAHIGNMRTFLFEDLLIRTLKYKDYSVNHVRNITDVDDKIIQKCQDQNLSLSSFTEKYTEIFMEDVTHLNFDQTSTTYLKATEYITSMIELIQELVDHGHAYDSEDGVYFKISSFSEYGNFTGLDLKNIQEGAAGVEGEYQKEDFGDFVLWKKYKQTDGSVFWDSPWGKGRPGWHTECAAIVRESFSNGLDIHTGGIDLLFPHHTNEKAHCECLTHKSMARFWLHATHLLVDNKKMSKSLGNFYTIRDLLEQGFDYRTIRFYLQTGAHYRSPLNFTLEGLKGAESALKRLDNFICEMTENPKEGEKYSLKAKFDVHIQEDLNISGAIGEIFTIINIYYSGEKIDTVQILLELKEINNILGVIIFPEQNILNEETKELYNLRIKARLENNWAESDRLRDELLKHGIEIRDSKEGTSVRKI